MQEVPLSASFANARCQSARSHHVCMQKAPILNLPRLFLPSSSDSETISGSQRNCKRDHHSMEDCLTPGTRNNHDNPDEERTSPSACSLKKCPQPSRAAQSAVCEYIAMLSCGISPAHAMLSGLGEMRDGEMHTWSWEGLIGGSSASHAVHACMEKVADGKWPWACVLLHGFSQSPFAWKRKDTEDEALQKLVRLSGRRCGHVAGAAGESVGALLLLPGSHVCLIAMSETGDNFCKF
jgi:hypothetical protein